MLRQAKLFRINVPTNIYFIKVACYHFTIIKPAAAATPVVVNAFDKVAYRY